MGCPHHRSRLEDDCSDGVRGLDVGDAGVRSCSYVGQSELLAKHAWRARVLLQRWYRRVRAGNASHTRGRAARRPRGSQNVTDCYDATRCFASYVCRRGTFTRGQTVILPWRDASFRLVYPSQTSHWHCRGTLLRQSDAKRDRTIGPYEYGHRARFAQPSTRGANFVPAPFGDGPPGKRTGANRRPRCSASARRWR